MTLIARAHITSAAAPTAFFARWADMSTWPEWNTDTEWVHLDGPFVPGATGQLKPKGGPKVSFRVARLTDHEFVDVSRLVGARLIFEHRVTVVEGKTQVEVVISLDGPLRRVWIALMGKGLRASAQRDLDALAATVEADVAAAA